MRKPSTIPTAHFAFCRGKSIDGGEVITKNGVEGYEWNTHHSRVCNCGIGIENRESHHFFMSARHLISGIDRSNFVVSELSSSPKWHCRESVASSGIVMSRYHFTTVATKGNEKATISWARLIIWHREIRDDQYIMLTGNAVQNSLYYTLSVNYGRRNVMSCMLHWQAKCGSIIKLWWCSLAVAAATARQH